MKILLGLSVLGILLSTSPLAEVALAEQKSLNDLLGSGDALSFGAFVDTFASIDFNRFEPRTRTYLTQPSRDREPNINLSFGELRLSTDSYRGRLALQGGTSVDSNYAAEPESGVKYIQESVVGTKLAEGLWIDAGIYLSHIGMESWISRDNWGYTRLLASEFSPYYQSGAKITYDATPNWSFQLHFLNGWQNISHFDGRSALGTQVVYTTNNKWQFIYNTFLGNELEGTRFFNDFLLKPPPFGTLEFSALFDIGTQERKGNQDQWWTGAVLLRSSLSDSLKLIARAEQYNDPDHVIVSTSARGKFGITGISTGVDRELAKRLWWRTEYRAFFAQDPVFPAGEHRSKSTDHFIVTSLSYSL